MTQRITIETPEGQALRADRATSEAAGNPLRTLTLAEALAWIDTTVTDLASAKAALKHITKALFVLRREVERARQG